MIALKGGAAQAPGLPLIFRERVARWPTTGVSGPRDRPKRTGRRCADSGSSGRHGLNGLLRPPWGPVTLPCCHVHACHLELLTPLAFSHPQEERRAFR